MIITGIKINYNISVTLFYTTMLLFTWRCKNAWKYIDRKFKKNSLQLESVLVFSEHLKSEDVWGDWKKSTDNKTWLSLVPEQSNDMVLL